ncbi:MAG: TPM domain-containing protein [Saprospiraceae bacterium]
MNRFFSKAEEDIIINSIRSIELASECEVRVHVDYADPKISPMDAALKVFYKLKMDRTRNRNGVLILLLPDRKEFAILGDIAIHEKVDSNFWETTQQLMSSYFMDCRFVQGTCFVIEHIGVELKKHFPSVNDHNELPDEISYS